MIIKWIAPLEPFIKLNTGGNSLDNPGLAGAVVCYEMVYVHGFWDFP